MNKDNRLMYEALDEKHNSDAKLKVALTALKDVYKHLTSEPTDVGHPKLITIVKAALDKVG